MSQEEHSRNVYKQLPEWARDRAVSVMYELDHSTEPEWLDLGVTRWSCLPKEEIWNALPEELEMPMGERMLAAVDDIWLLCWIARAKMLAKVIDWESQSDLDTLAEHEQLEHETFLPKMISKWQDAEFDPFEKNFKQLLETFKVHN